MELLIDKNREYRRYRHSVSEKIQLANNGLQHIQSSNVSAAGIDDKDLIIRFHNGSMYRYYDQGKLFDSMLKSNSKGHFVWVKLRRTGVPYSKIGVLRFRDDDEVTDDDIFKLVDNEGLAFQEKMIAMGMFLPQQTSLLNLISLNDLL